MDYPDQATADTNEPFKADNDVGKYIHSEEYYFDVWRDQQEKG